MSVTLHTNVGPLKLELETALTPRTCKNFLALCASGQYNGNQFHRVIKGFIAQAGKGRSTFDGAPLLDELAPSLTHGARGVLAMATRGPNTAASQFYLTFGPAPHLDAIDSVFGKLIDGFETLDAIEAVTTNEKNVPVDSIIIQSVTIHNNPFAESDNP